MRSREILVEAGQVDGQYWQDLWHYRELLYLLTWRDIVVRYKQTTIGVAWALIRPLVTMLVLTVVFGRLAGLPSEGVPYPILVCAAVLPWQLFSTAMTEASNCVVGNSNLISKVYFPRLLVPLSAVGVCMIDFLISLGLLAALMLWFRFVPGWQVIFLPLLIALAVASATGAGIWLAALNVRYRDFRYVIPFLMQFGLYVSPVGFSSSIIPENLRLVYAVNPMVGVIEGFRWSIRADEGALPWPELLVSVGVAAVFLAAGIWYFRKIERSMVDIL